MKERPIIFSGPMVRAIREGGKTQTRRVVKIPDWFRRDYMEIGKIKDDVLDEVISLSIPCPYGAPGDRLWVRETWGLYTGKWNTIVPKGTVAYRANHGFGWGGCEYDLMRWRPSIHMPRWASRITLEIVSVRVERLNGISDLDAVAEGYPSRYDFLSGEWAQRQMEGGLDPWVWVIEFKPAPGAEGGR